MGNHYSHLSQTDRVAIQLLLQAGCSRRQIADKLGCGPSTICREIIRGKSSPTALPNSYRASVAQSQSQGRRAGWSPSKSRAVGADCGSSHSPRNRSFATTLSKIETEAEGTPDGAPGTPPPVDFG